MQARERIIERDFARDQRDGGGAGLRGLDRPVFVHQQQVGGIAWWVVGAIFLSAQWVGLERTCRIAMDTIVGGCFTKKTTRIQKNRELLRL